MSLGTLSICLLFLSTGAALAQSPLPRAPSTTLFTISASTGHFTEPSIAINPRNPNQIVAVYQGGETVQGGGGSAYSTDAGRTFHMAGGTKPSDWRVVGDVTTTFDNRGHAFLCYLAFDRLGTSSYWAHNAGRNGIFVRRSLDGGKTWERNATAVKAFSSDHDHPKQFEDEPRIFADNGAKSQYAGNLYTGWVEWQLDKSVMLFSRSTDDGKTWSPAIQVSTHPGFPRDDNGGLGGFMQAISADGTIYAIWDDGNFITLAESGDGGKSFSKPRAIFETGPPYFGDVPGPSRVSGFPQIGVEPGGPKGGDLYITWSDYRNGDVDVFLSRSSDHGRTWSTPVRVNDDALHNGCDQFFQWMTVDPVTGTVYVLFYDRRDDPQNSKIRLTLARSTDKGQTFKNYALTETAFDAQGAFLGDYTWLAALNHRVYGIWTETAPPIASAIASHQGSGGGAKTIIRIGVADFSHSK